MSDRWTALAPVTPCPTTARVLEALEDPEVQTSLAVAEREADYPTLALERLHEAGLADLLVGTSPGPTSTGLFHVDARCAQVSASLAITVGVNGLALLPTHLAENRPPWVEQRIRDQRPAAMLLTEWAHGSDLAANTTRAERTLLDGAPAYRVTGEKHLINGVRRAGILVVLARTSAPSGPLGGASGMSLFLVDPDAAGVSLLDRHATLPVPAADIGGVRLDVVVPEANRLGPEGGGFALVHRSLAMSRGGISAFAAGTSHRALSLMRRHADQRILYGEPIRCLGPIAEHLVRAESFDLLATAVSWKAERLVNSLGPGAVYGAAVAKAAGCRFAEQVVEEGRQICGARALIEGPYAQVVRDVLLYGVFDGTRHVVLEQVATRLRQIASGRGCTDTLGPTRDMYTAPARPLRTLVGNRRPWVPDPRAHLRALAALPGERCDALIPLADALVHVASELICTDRWDPVHRIALAAVLSELEATIAVLELADPQRRVALGLREAGDAEQVRHVVADRAVVLTGRVADLADSLEIRCDLRQPALHRDAEQCSRALRERIRHD